jgi:antitoxin (DNA-binding transcriptional repressor) of toxin-antitoxin stability system
MKTVTAMAMRRQFGGLLDEVRLTSEPVVIERDGKPMALLSPLPASAAQADIKERRRNALNRLCGLSQPTVRGRRPQGWLKRERAAWAGREA